MTDKHRARCYGGCCDVSGRLPQELFLQLLADSSWFEIQYEILSPVQMWLSAPEQCFKCHPVISPQTKCRTLDNSLQLPTAPLLHLENNA